MSPIIIALTPGDRLQLATAIERLINMLDEIEGDCDFEDVRDDYEPSMGSNECREGQSQTLWASQDADDECEEENEHGGDVQDERHDDQDEGNAEPFMGWGERCGQWQVTQELERAEGEPSTWDDPNDTDIIDYPGFRALEFEGSGYRVGKDQLRDLGRRRPDRHQNYVRTSPGYGWMS